MVVCDDVYFFKHDETVWSFVRELEPIQNQGLFNRRLNRILHDDKTLIFVYNNRIRKYSLDDGELIENKAVKNAREINVTGEMLEFR